MSSLMGVTIVVYSVGWMAIACMDSRRLRDSHDAQHQLGLETSAMRQKAPANACLALFVANFSTSATLILSSTPYDGIVQWFCYERFGDAHLTLQLVPSSPSAP